MAAARTFSRTTASHSIAASASASAQTRVANGSGLSAAERGDLFKDDGGNIYADCEPGAAAARVPSSGVTPAGVVEDADDLDAQLMAAFAEEEVEDQLRSAFSKPAGAGISMAASAAQEARDLSKKSKAEARERALAASKSNESASANVNDQEMSEEQLDLAMKRDAYEKKGANARAKKEARTLAKANGASKGSAAPKKTDANAAPVEAVVGSSKGKRKRDDEEGDVDSANKKRRPAKESATSHVASLKKADEVARAEATSVGSSTPERAGDGNIGLAASTFSAAIGAPNLIDASDDSDDSDDSEDSDDLDNSNTSAYDYWREVEEEEKRLEEDNTVPTDFYSLVDIVEHHLYPRPDIIQEHHSFTSINELFDAADFDIDNLRAIVQRWPDGRLCVVISATDLNHVPVSKAKIAAELQLKEDDNSTLTDAERLVDLVDDWVVPPPGVTREYYNRRTLPDVLEAVNFDLSNFKAIVQLWPDGRVCIVFSTTDLNRVPGNDQKGNGVNGASTASNGEENVEKTVTQSVVKKTKAGAAAKPASARPKKGAAGNADAPVPSRKTKAGGAATSTSARSKKPAHTNGDDDEIVVASKKRAAKPKPSA